MTTVLDHIDVGSTQASPALRKFLQANRTVAQKLMTLSVASTLPEEDVLSLKQALLENPDPHVESFLERYVDADFALAVLEAGEISRIYLTSSGLRRNGARVQQWTKPNNNALRVESWVPVQAEGGSELRTHMVTTNFRKFAEDLYYHVNLEAHMEAPGVTVVRVVDAAPKLVVPAKEPEAA